MKKGYGSDEKSLSVYDLESGGSSKTCLQRKALLKYILCVCVCVVRGEVGPIISIGNNMVNNYINK